MPLPHRLISLCLHELCNEIKEIEEVLKGKLGLLGRNGLSAVGRVIAHHANEVQTPIQVITNDVLELHRIDKSDQRILIQGTTRRP